ncbi:MAG: hypothetical protein ACKOB8_00390 [Mycobacterium sp.]
MAEALRDRVAAGEYASESEVIREGALFARDRAVEAGLSTEVTVAYDAAVADASRTVSAQAVRARIARGAGQRRVTFGVAFTPEAQEQTVVLASTVTSPLLGLRNPLRNKRIRS